jgi:hypothetical protein
MKSRRIANRLWRENPTTSKSSSSFLRSDGKFEHPAREVVGKSVED